MTHDISDESVKIFTDLPHGDREIDEIVSGVRKSILDHRKPLDKPGLAFGRDYSLDGMLVLDAGCGSGLKAIPIAAKGANHVIGLDGSSVAIERAQQVATVLGIDNVHFVHGRIENLRSILDDLSVSSVDLVVNLQNLHHTTDWRDNLKVFARCLSDDGVLVCNIADPTSGFGGFMVKNKIAYVLGKDVGSRLRIGRFLFGWWDGRHNIMNLKEDAFYADRYSAFYHWIRPGSMLRALDDAGFELVDSFPAVRLEHWLRGVPFSSRAMTIAKIIEVVPPMRYAFYSLMRIRQFLFGGDNRTYYARKKAAIK